MLTYPKWNPQIDSLQHLKKTREEQLKTEPKKITVPFPASFTKAGTRMRVPFEPTGGRIARALLFGSGSVKEVREFFDKNVTVLFFIYYFLILFLIL